MTAKKLNNHIQNLISTGLAEIKHGHLMLDSVHTQKTFYKSSINFTDTTNFKEVKELLTLEYLKYTTHIQNKIIGIRNDIADSTIKAKVSKRKIKIVTKQKESFASEPIITFRNIAKVLNLSLTETYNILSLLKSKDFISLETKKICLGRSSGKLENFKDVLPLFAYSFISKGFLYQILGSNLSIL